MEALPFIDVQVISVAPTTEGRSKINAAIEKIFFAALKPFVKIPQPDSKKSLEAAAKVLAGGNGKNLLICPAGKVVVKNQESWFSGVGAIIKEAYAKNPSLNIAFLNVRGRRHSQLSNPMPVSQTALAEILANKNSMRREITDKIREMYEGKLGVAI